MRFTSQRLTRLLLPVVSGAGCMIALLSAVNAIEDWKNQAPRLGDMIAFTPVPQIFAAGAQRIPVETSDHRYCVLDVRTLQRQGGSFVVGGRLADEEARFVVHWAGKGTADGAGNCGASADLVLDKRQIDALDSAASGTGVKAAPVSLADRTD